MADYKVPYSEAGLAAFEALDNYSQQFLLTGSHPPLAPGFPMKVPAGVTFKQFAVVGLDGDELAMATWDADPADAIKAVGITSQAVTGAADGSTTVPTLYSGCFNPDILEWDASFDTEGKKMGAFNGAPTPTQIALRKRG
jgi:hypothetical protein